MQELYFPLNAVLVAGERHIFYGKAKTFPRSSLEIYTGLSGTTTRSEGLTIIERKILTIAT